MGRKKICGEGGQGNSMAESLGGINGIKTDILAKAHTPAVKLYKQKTH